MRRSTLEKTRARRSLRTTSTRCLTASPQRSKRSSSFWSRKNLPRKSVDDCCARKLRRARRFNESPAHLGRVEARVLAELGNQREAVFVRDDLGNFKVDDSLGAHKVARPRWIPVDRCAAGELKGPSAVELDEQQSRVWVNRQIAKGVEHVVAVVIRKRDAPIVKYLDESRVSSLVGCIGPRSGVFGRNEESVGA